MTDWTGAADTWMECGQVAFREYISARLFRLRAILPTSLHCSLVIAFVAFARVTRTMHVSPWHTSDDMREDKKTKVQLKSAPCPLG